MPAIKKMMEHFKKELMDEILRAVKTIEHWKVQEHVMPIYALLERDHLYDMFAERITRSQFGSLLTEMIALKKLEMGKTGDDLYLRQPEIDLPSNL